MLNVRSSSSKNNHPIENIFNTNHENFWSSEGELPHLIELNFDEISPVHHIQIYLSYISDDSYTPENVLIYTGMTRDSMKLKSNEKFSEPEGYKIIYIKEDVRFIYIVILSNHQEGKDSHMREILVMECENKQYFLS